MRVPVVERQVAATPERVWDVLSDGWLYPCWVVGAARMRDVDSTWPEPGARLHHSVGGWPAMLDDDTEVLAAHPPHELRLRARAWPTGSAEVHLRIEGNARGCRVTIQEDAVNGPATLVPRVARQLGMVPRNREALRRLALIAEGDAHL